MMITASQLRAARGMLDWTRNDLAKAASLSPETIKNIEHGVFRPQEATADQIRRAFAMHDVEFTDDEGIRFNREGIKQYSGADEFKRFMDDVYTVAARDPEAVEGGKNPIYVSNVDDRLFVEHLGIEFINMHAQRMSELKNVKVRVLVGMDEKHQVPEALHHIEYRRNNSQATGDVPFYVYGDKFAVLMFNHKPSPQIVVINSKLVSSAYRAQFDILWKNTEK